VTDLELIAVWILVLGLEKLLAGTILGNPARVLSGLTAVVVAILVLI